MKEIRDEGEERKERNRRNGAEEGVEEEGNPPPFPYHSWRVVPKENTLGAKIEMLSNFLNNASNTF